MSKQGGDQLSPVLLLSLSWWEKRFYQGMLSIVSLTCTDIFLSAKNYLFLCRERCRAHFKWKEYFLCFFAVWQARVAHNPGWEEGSSSPLARKAGKTCQDNPANVGKLRECLCSVLCFQTSQSDSFQSLPMHRHREKEKICVSCPGVASGLITPEKWLAKCEHPEGLVFYLDWIILCRDPASHRVMWHSGQHFKTNK